MKPAPNLFSGPNWLYGGFGGKIVPDEKLCSILPQKPTRIRFSKKHVFGLNFLMKPAPYLFSGPNWLYDGFGGKIVPDENFAQFCFKSPLEFGYRTNTFSDWIFVLKRTSPIFLAKRIRWHDWGQKCPGVKFRPS